MPGLLQTFLNSQLASIRYDFWANCGSRPIADGRDGPLSGSLITKTFGPSSSSKPQAANFLEFAILDEPSKKQINVFLTVDFLVDR
jgi:hypothetical protein